MNMCMSRSLKMKRKTPDAINSHYEQAHRFVPAADPQNFPMKLACTVILKFEWLFSRR